MAKNHPPGGLDAAARPARSAYERSGAAVQASSYAADLLAELQRRLDAAERRFEAVARNIPDVVFSFAGNTTTYVSPQVERVCGFTPEEVLRSRDNIWIDRIHTDDLQRVQAAYFALPRSKSGFDIEYRWQRKDGVWIWVRTRVSVSPGSDSTVDGILSDVTERKLLEEQIQQLQRMEPVGQFTSGIAHDFNNLLAVILGNNNLLLDAIDAGDPRRMEAEAILQAAQQAAALTRQLLAYARREEMETTVLDLNETVQRTETMLRRLIGEDVELSMALAHDAGHVRADAGQIEQIIMNLVVNARDAMPFGGKLSISTGRAIFSRHDGRNAEPEDDGEVVTIAVGDTGCGMDAETRRRVFEPLFTTKANGKGTGLGLSTCASIVKRLGGYIRVDSEPDHGSVFTVYLPRVQQQPEPSAVGADHKAAEEIGDETVLLVEDDERVRGLVKRVLERCGYRILSARDGQEALAISQTNEKRIDLILCDLILPDLSGTEIVCRIRARAPDIRALFMSGHANHALLEDGTLQQGAQFIQKPFLPRALVEKVREVLDA